MLAMSNPAPNPPPPPPKLGYNKLVAMSGAGAVTTLITYVVHQIFAVDVPPEVATALTTLIAGIAQYVTPEKVQ